MGNFTRIHGCSFINFFGQNFHTSRSLGYTSVASGTLNDDFTQFIFPIRSEEDNFYWLA